MIHVRFTPSNSYWKLMPILLIALAIFLLYLFVPIALAIKNTKPLMEASAPYTQAPENATMRILVMGDSTAVGTGGRPEESIAGRLGKDYPHATIVNDSENGLKLKPFVERLRARSEEHYDLIVFQIGANDIVMFTPTKHIEGRLREALAIARTMAPNTIVLCAGNVGLAPVFKWPLSLMYTERTRPILEKYEANIAEYPEMRYVDLFNERKDEPFNKDPKRFYAKDGFHPSGDGYGIWYEKVREAIDSLEPITR